jgi:hypothetical protein
MSADAAYLFFSEGVALAAMTNRTHCVQQRLAQQLGSNTVMLQKMQRHPLRGFGAHSRKPPKGFGKRLQRVWIGRQGTHMRR